MSEELRVRSVTYQRMQEAAMRAELLGHDSAIAALWASGWPGLDLRQLRGKEIKVVVDENGY